MSMQLQAVTALLGVLCSANVFGADIYRCEINGVTTFVDSPSRCPQGGSRRYDGDNTPKPKMQAPEQDAARPAPRASASSCKGLAQNPVSFRQCLRDVRRTEARQIATHRLEAISRAITDHVNQAASQNDVMAVSNKGRSPGWCESILDDVMALRNLKVIDDESIGGPRWVSSGSGTERTAADILDDDFREWDVAGSKVPDGYVTVLWQGSELLVLRVVAACTEAADKTARCNPVRYTGIFVYDDKTPLACDVTAVGRAYWGNWKNSMTPILNKGATRSDWPRPERKTRRTPRTLPE